MITIKDLLVEGRQVLEASNVEGSYTAVRSILCHILNVEDKYLYLHPEQGVSDKRTSEYWQKINLRKSKVPLAYIVGEKEFYGRKFYLNEHVLIPRPETELIVNHVTGLVKLGKIKVDEPYLDLCTGSGVIAISLVKECGFLKAKASDISCEALEIAKKNANHHQADIQFYESDLFQTFGPHHKFQLITSNPPYIDPDDEINLAPELAHEPSQALFSSEKGLSLIQRMIREAQYFLAPGGYLIFEFGQYQEKEIEKLLNHYGYSNIEFYKDLSCIFRCVVAQSLDR